MARVSEVAVFDAPADEFGDRLKLFHGFTVHTSMVKLIERVAAFDGS
jgi:hypothetical protein